MMIKNRIFEVMATRGFRKASDLARAAEISKSTLYRTMNDEAASIHYDTLERLCKVLDVQPGDLLTYEPDEVPQ